MANVKISELTDQVVANLTDSHEFAVADGTATTALSFGNLVAKTIAHTDMQAAINAMDNSTLAQKGVDDAAAALVAAQAAQAAADDAGADAAAAALTGGGYGPWQARPGGPLTVWSHDVDATEYFQNADINKVCRIAGSFTRSCTFNTNAAVTTMDPGQGGVFGGDGTNTSNGNMNGSLFFSTARFNSNGTIVRTYGQFNGNPDVFTESGQGGSSTSPGPPIAGSYHPGLAVYGEGIRDGMFVCGMAIGPGNNHVFSMTDENGTIFGPEANGTNVPLTFDTGIPLTARKVALLYSCHQGGISIYQGGSGGGHTSDYADGYKHKVLFGNNVDGTGTFVCENHQWPSVWGNDPRTNQSNFSSHRVTGSAETQWDDIDSYSQNIWDSAVAGGAGHDGGSLFPNAQGRMAFRLEDMNSGPSRHLEMKIIAYIL